MIEQKIKKITNGASEEVINKYIKEESRRGFIVKSMVSCSKPINNMYEIVLLLEREIPDQIFEVTWEHLKHDRSNGSNDYKCSNCGYIHHSIYTPVECPVCHGKTKEEELPVTFG